MTLAPLRTSPWHTPGDPAAMNEQLRATLRALLTGTSVTIRQEVERLEALTGWETANRYTVRGPDGNIIVLAEEQGTGARHALSRNFNPFRTIELECLTLDGIVALRMVKPWTFWLRRAEVFAWNGELMGRLQERFVWFGRKLEVCTPGGEVLAELRGPWWRPWTFHVFAGEHQVGEVRKQWRGMLTEAFTDADTFELQLSPTLTSGVTRQLLLAATLLVDLLWFENRGGRKRGGVLGLLAE